MADTARRRPRVPVDFLKKLGVPVEAAETDAEGMEHFVFDVTWRALTKFIDSNRS
ncbi:iron dependent repressor, metal binding and dimerization domain protein [Acidiphilium sp.]|uniref:iron dependent repressor, metal binding and dimerization domain protein n=1 Tax=Acidiphilium sp. TaxID=527 RepID=UPI003D085A1C